MAKNNVLEWDTTANNNSDIGGTGILGTNAVNNFDDAFRTLMAQVAAGIVTRFTSRATGYTAVKADYGQASFFTAAATLSLTAAATLTAGWEHWVYANGGDVVVDPNGAETINGVATVTVPSGQSALIRCNGTAFYAQIFGAAQSGAGLQGFRYGLTLSNSPGDLTNDIDIAVGAAAADTSPYAVMSLASIMTKRLDAAWAVGSGNGGRMSAAAIADTSYHVWLIQRSDTGVVDVGFDVSATAPTMPANYDRKRRIGTIIRQSGSILLFTQENRTFLLYVPILARNSTAALASSLLGFGVPTGIQVEPLIFTRIDNNAGSVATISIGSASGGSANTAVHTQGGVSAGNSRITVGGGFLTNTTSQLYAAQTLDVGTISTGNIGSNGWIDTFL